MSVHAILGWALIGLAVGGWLLLVLLVGVTVSVERERGYGLNNIVHERECAACGATTYQYERCHECGDVPWKEGEA